MARLPDLQLFAAEHGLKIGTIADLIEHRSRTKALVEKIGSRPLTRPSANSPPMPGATSPARACTWRWCAAVEPDETVPVRVHEPLSVLDALESTAPMHIPGASTPACSTSRAPARASPCCSIAANRPTSCWRSSKAPRARAGARARPHGPAHLRRRRADPARMRRAPHEPAGHAAAHAQHGRLRPRDRGLPPPHPSKDIHVWCRQGQGRPAGRQGPVHRHRAGPLQRRTSPTRWPRPAGDELLALGVQAEHRPRAGARARSKCPVALQAMAEKAATTRWSRWAASSAARPTTSSWWPTSRRGVTRVALDYQLPIANAILTTENWSRPSPARPTRARRRPGRRRDGQPAGTTRMSDERTQRQDRQPPPAPARPRPSPRSRAREFALQALYQHLVGRNDAEAIDRLHARPGRLPQGRLGALRRPAARLHREAAELDALILPLLDRKLAEISPIEHAVMWIGAYEFQHALDVPWRVVLNECIELAKEFGGTDGHKYVNAVLNGLAPQLRPAEVDADRAAGRRADEDLARAERIEPFYVMEVAKAAGALAREVARSDRPMIFLNIGEPDFTAPPLVQEAAERAIRAGATQYTHATGLDALREAHQRLVPPALRRGRAGAPHRGHGRRLGGAAAGLPGADRGRRRDPDAGPELPLQPAFRERRRRHRGADADHRRRSASSSAPPRSRPTGTRARAACCWPRRPIRPAPRSTPTNCAASTPSCARGGITLLDEIYLGLSYDHLRPHRAGARRPGHQHQQLLQVLQHDRLAPGLDGGARSAGAGGRAPRAEPVHLPSTVAQHAALACFEPESIAEYERRRAEFKARRDWFIPQLEALGLPVPVVPDGAFYAWADCSACVPKAGHCRQLGLRLRGHEARHVAVTPGRDFGTRRHQPLRPLLHRQLDGAPAGSGGAAEGQVLGPDARRSRLSRSASTGKTPMPAASSSTPTT
jgi:transcription antitermination factor NusB